MTAVYTFIAEEQADPACERSVCEMCRVLEVSRSGFYDGQTRGPSQRALDDAVLACEIELIWIASGETYGVPRMTAWLVKQGFEVNHKRVGRIMRQLGLEGESGRPTGPHHDRRQGRHRCIRSRPTRLQPARP